MGAVIFIIIAGIIILLVYITSLREKAALAEKFGEESRKRYHENLELQRTLDIEKIAQKKAIEEIAIDTAKKIKALENELEIHRHALEPRINAEPWLASYILQLKTATDAYALDRKRGYKTIKELERRFREKYKPAVAASITLKARIAEYESLFPGLSEYVEVTTDTESDHLEDGGRQWLSDGEFETLSTTERNQLILDRYHTRHTKSKWQIGRDYELYIGHVFKRKGYTNIIQYGIEKKLEDLGIDIIATNPETGKIAYIQCKNWSQYRTVRENTVTQLYAGALIHMLNNNENPALAEYHICTSTEASDLAKQCAKILGVELHENIALGNYPSIKCHKDTANLGFGSKIYHLPIDQMYDRTISVDHYASTVEEAERLGYRRAFRWHGNITPV
jgi:hypothetical protein